MEQPKPFFGEVPEGKLVYSTKLDNKEREEKAAAKAQAAPTKDKLEKQLKDRELNKEIGDVRRADVSRLN